MNASIPVRLRYDPLRVSDLPPDSVTVQRDGLVVPIEAPRRTLLVLGNGFSTSVPLGPTGKVTVGRSSDNLVEIDEPAVSRHHLVLHLGREVTLEDLGSSNGTRVGGAAITPSSKMRLDPGVPVELGTTMLILQERAIAATPRRLWPWEYFEARIEEECRRARRLGTQFSILHLRCAERESAPVLERRLAAMLPRLDVVARYVPGEYEVLLVGVEASELEAEIRALASALADGMTLTIGHARFPDDGREPDALVGVAALRAQEGEAEADDAALCCESQAMAELVRMIERVAVDPLPILVVGETGTGKEIVAREIHRRSGRAAAAFIRVECSGVAVDLDPTSESGAKLLASRGATIVFDEVCELDAAQQAKLVRLLEAAERQAEQGGDAPRFVATTRHDLEAEVAQGRFRIDLYHRLDGVTLVVPPLRRRREDLEPLVDAFATESAARLGRETPVFSELAIGRLATYRWPGNVRELRNIVRRAVLMADGPAVLPQHLPLEKLGAAYEEPPDAPSTGHSAVREQFQAVECQRIVEALTRAGGNQTEAAKLLGISRRTLVKRLDLYDLPRPRKK